MGESTRHVSRDTTYQRRGQGPGQPETVELLEQQKQIDRVGRAGDNYRVLFSHMGHKIIYKLKGETV